MMDLLNELKSRKDRDIRAQLEQQEIQRALKEIDRDKASALERDKRRELERIAAERENLRYREESVMDEIKNLEEKVYEGERKLQEQRKTLQGKVDKSEYLTKGMRDKEIELAKQRGEELAKLKHKKELLEEDRQRIMDNLDNVKNGDLNAIRKNEASRWVANDIISKSNLDFKNIQLSDSMKNKLVSNQARINKLKEEKAKIEKEAFPAIDELDILQKQYEDKEFNQKARMVADDLDDRNIRPDIKANQMRHMRDIIEQRGGPQNFDLDETTHDLQQKINNLKNDYLDNDKVDPELKDRMDELQNVVKTARGGNQPNLAMPNPLVGAMPPGIPPFGPGVPPMFPGAMPGGFGGFPPPFPGAPFGPAPVAENNPGLNYLKSQLEKQEEENKKLQEELTGNGIVL